MNKIVTILIICLFISSIAGVYATIEHNTNIDTFNKTDDKSATVVTNASSGDCANITFNTEGNDYESYCVEKGEDAPEIGTDYVVEENLTSTGKITDEQAQKIKIFSIKYRDINLTHNTINPKTGNPVKEIDDATSRQLIIWDILGQADKGWYERNYVNKTIIDDINELYDGGLRYGDNGFIPLNNTHQFNYIFKYFSSIESSLQDFLGWLFVESDIPPQDNTTNETEPVHNQTEPDNETQTDDNKTTDENNTKIIDDDNNTIIGDNTTSNNISDDNKTAIPLLNTGNQWGFLVFAVLIIVGVLLIRRL